MGQTSRIVAKGLAEISLYGEIKAGDAIAFQTKLKQLSPRNIRVRINSGGGDLFEAVAIYNTLAAYRPAVEVVIDAYAASAASLIAMAGKPLIMPAYAFLMLHNPWQKLTGAAKPTGFNDAMASAYAKKSGKSVAAVRRMMDAETWLTAEQARAAGFCDSVTEAVPIAASRKAPPFVDSFSDIWARFNRPGAWSQRP